MKARILVIDDEAAIRDSMRMILEYEGYEFLGAATGEEGIALADREAVDLVFLDIKMPGMDGLEVLRQIKDRHPALPVIMVTATSTSWRCASIAPSTKGESPDCLCPRPATRPTSGGGRLGRASVPALPLSCSSGM